MSSYRGKDALGGHRQRLDWLVAEAVELGDSAEDEAQLRQDAQARPEDRGAAGSGHPSMCFPLMIVPESTV